MLFSYGVHYIATCLALFLTNLLPLSFSYLLFCRIYFQYNIYLFLQSQIVHQPYLYSVTVISASVFNLLTVSLSFSALVSCLLNQCVFGHQWVNLGYNMRHQKGSAKQMSWNIKCSFCNFYVEPPFPFRKLSTEAKMGICVEMRIFENVWSEENGYEHSDRYYNDLFCIAT